MYDQSGDLPWYLSTIVPNDRHMGRFDHGVETHFLCHFARCIARLVAPVQKHVQQIFFLQVDQLSGSIILILVHFYFRK